MTEPGVTFAATRTSPVRVGGNWIEDRRCWGVIERDCAEDDGRLVGSSMTHEDAVKIAALLNAAAL